MNSSLARAFTIAGEAKLTLRAESINLGVITNTLNDGRTFRLGVQLGW